MLHTGKTRKKNKGRIITQLLRHMVDGVGDRIVFHFVVDPCSAMLQHNLVSFCVDDLGELWGNTQNIY